MNPTVSFVVPCYNYGAFVGQAIDSLLDQTFESIEIIAIDDASTDETPRMLGGYDGNPRVHVIRHERNRGHVHSYNEGLMQSRGRFIGLLSADDYAARPDAVARQVAIFQEHPGVGFVYAAHQLVDPQGRVRSVSRPWEHDYTAEGRDEFARLVFMNYVPHSGTLVRWSCHERLGLYETRLPHACDWDMWLRIASSYDVGYISDPLYAYRIHDTNMSHAVVSPGQAMDEQLLTLERNFARLAQSGESDLLRLKNVARRRTLLSTVWHDLANGRTRRSWQGLAATIARSPRLVVHRDYCAAVLRAIVLTTAGCERYRKLYGGFAP